MFTGIINGQGKILNLESHGDETRLHIQALYALDAIIPGAKRPDQIFDNLQTLKVHLTPADLVAIDELFR